MGLANQLEVAQNNKLNTYFPIRTKDERKKLDWDSILGQVVAAVYRKALINNDFDDFMAICAAEFENKLDDSDFWKVIKEMYFDNQDALSIAPEFLLFKSSQKSDSHNTRLGNMFVNLMEYVGMEDDFTLNFTDTKLNFIENIIYSTLKDKGFKDEKEKYKLCEEIAYLPFMAKAFRDDLKFLSGKPKYLLSNFDNFLKLYGFLYTVQLTLNIKDWRNGEPVSKKNYVILDTERASQERRFVKDFGFKQLRKHLPLLFPYLSMAETLQGKNKPKIPLWQLANAIKEDAEITVKLDDFAKKFVTERELHFEIFEQNDPIASLEQLLQVASAQFKTGNKGKDDINKNYARAAEMHLCHDFVQRRGTVGATLVINQDYIMLLTNIAIGDNDRLRLHELIKAFESRGIYFDNQSQQELVTFYERIGNVERMSDSGDAVYVRKTI